MRCGMPHACSQDAACRSPRALVRRAAVIIPCGMPHMYVSSAALLAQAAGSVAAEVIILGPAQTLQRWPLQRLGIPEARTFVFLSPAALAQK